MMLVNPDTLWVIAQARQEELLKDLQTRQLLRQVAETRRQRPKIWRKLSGRLGNSIMTIGHRLQAQQQFK